MKNKFKIIGNNIFYIIEINLILFIAYIWALFGVAFNDTSVFYNNIIEALPTIIFGVLPLLVGSIILIIHFRKKENFNIIAVSIFQIIMVILALIFYITNYVPTSKINLFIENTLLKNELKKQENINNIAIDKIKNGFILYDSVCNENALSNIYINKNTMEVIIDHEDERGKNYAIAKATIKDVNCRNTYYLNNTTYSICEDEYRNLSFKYNGKNYYINDNAVINKNSINYADRIYIVANDGNYFTPFGTHIGMIKSNIQSGNTKYYINGKKPINIEKTVDGVKVSDESINDFKIMDDYTWVFIYNGEEILSRAVNDTSLNFKNDLTKQDFYSLKGKYELYLKIYDSNLGYYRISNIVSWEN